MYDLIVFWVKPSHPYLIALIKNAWIFGAIMFTFVAIQGHTYLIALIIGLCAGQLGRTQTLFVSN